MSTQNTRRIDSKAVTGIMNGRKLTKTSRVGKKDVFTIQGNGNVIDVTDKDGKVVTSTITGYEGTVLQKRILNTKSNSELAMSNPRTQGYLRDALKAERAGDADAAHELFNKYLNACQLSFGYLLPNDTLDAALGAGVDIAAEIVVVTTENGSLLTIDPKTIRVEEAGVQGGTTFDINSFMEEEEAPATKATAKAK